jgi:hypothetical protein
MASVLTRGGKYPGSVPLLERTRRPWGASEATGGLLDHLTAYRVSKGMVRPRHNSEYWGNNSEYWRQHSDRARKCAEQARQRAECSRDYLSKQVILKVAKRYDQMADCERQNCWVSDDGGHEMRASALITTDHDAGV